MLLFCFLTAVAFLYLFFQLRFYLRKPRFNGQWVWITGASSGIGEQLALAFARSGAFLLLSSRNKVELERVRGLCLRFTSQVQVIPLDLSRPSEVLSTAQEVAKQYPVSVLVNNAGVSQRAPLRSSLNSLDLEQKIFTTNYLGQVAVIKAVLPSMVTRRAGRIVYISSVAGLLEAPLRCYYGSSKAAASAYMESLRAEVAQDGISVTNVYPGYVQSNVAKNALGPEGKGGVVQDSNISQGMRTEAFASLTLRHIAYGSAEVIISQPSTRLFLWIKLYCPPLFNLLAPKMFSRLTNAFDRENS